VDGGPEAEEMQVDQWLKIFFICLQDFRSKLFFLDYLLKNAFYIYFFIKN
jgi:hypothetical protein